MSPLLADPPPSWRARMAALRDAVPLSPSAGGVVAAALAAVVVAVVLALGHGHRPPGAAAPTSHRDLGWTPPPTTTTSSPDVVVDVAGAVVRPGIVRLASGARVIDAVGAAGGPTAEAELDALNLAARVGDGDRVYVPRHGEPVPPESTAAASGRGAPVVVDVNTATAEQLDALPGIGPATAAAIVTYRTRHGPFSSVDGLLAVPGIGPAKLAALRPRLRV